MTLVEIVSFTFSVQDTKKRFNKKMLNRVGLKKGTFSV